MTQLHVAFFLGFVSHPDSLTQTQTQTQVDQENLPLWQHITATVFLLGACVSVVTGLLASGLSSGDALSLTLSLTGGIAGTTVIIINCFALLYHHF